MERVLVMDSNDNVATAISELTTGEEISVLIGAARKYIKVLDSVPFGHKIAIEDIPTNSIIYKYGQSIGKSTSQIKSCQHVHVHNIKTLRGGLK